MQEQEQEHMMGLGLEHMMGLGQGHKREMEQGQVQNRTGQGQK